MAGLPVEPVQLAVATADSMCCPGERGGSSLSPGKHGGLSSPCGTAMPATAAAAAVAGDAAMAGDAAAAGAGPVCFVVAILWKGDTNVCRSISAAPHRVLSVPGAELSARACRTCPPCPSGCPSGCPVAGTIGICNEEPCRSSSSRKSSSACCLPCCACCAERAAPCALSRLCGRRSEREVKLGWGYES